MQTESTGKGDRAVMRRVKLERTFAAEVEELWELWTTPEGLESWWCPEGFRVEVRRLEPVVGGQMECVMTADGSEQKDFLKKAGLPLQTLNRLTLTEFVPMRRLAYMHLIDFVPGVPPYEVAVEVDFAPVEGGATMTVTMDAMHSDWMTEAAKMGWESQLARLEARFNRPG
jgi:uncharacterized protein YndB with AHSA1/START domain